MDIRVSSLTLLVAMMTASGRAWAQDSACTYDRCALRLQVRLFSDRVVRGSAATSVARLGLFAPRIEPLASRSDSAGYHYEAFRQDQNRGGVLMLLGNASALAAGIVLTSSARRFDDAPDATWALLGVGFAFSLAGNINIRNGRDHLHRAIWFYNRSLPPSLE